MGGGGGRKKTGVFSAFFEDKFPNLTTLSVHLFHVQLPNEANFDKKWFTQKLFDYNFLRDMGKT